MASRWTDPAAFRADPSAAPAVRPTRRQSLALLVVLVLIAGAVAAASFVIRPDKAQAFDLLHGSVFIEDQAGPVAIDLASAKPTYRLLGAEQLVSMKPKDTLSLVPLEGGTLLLNTTSGEFNMVDNTGFAVKHDGSGVELGKPPPIPSAAGFASGRFAYIERTSASSTDVYLVGKLTVEAAVTSPKTVKARAGITIKDSGTTAPGGAAAANGDLWVLLGSGTHRTIRRLSVPPNSQAGAMLTSTGQGSVDGVAALGTATDGSGTTAVGIASSNRIKIFTPGAAATTVSFRASLGVDSILPATNAQGRLAFLMHSTVGWSVVSVGTDGSDLRGPTRLVTVPGDAKLIAPAASGGDLYTMDRTTRRIVRIDSRGETAAIRGAARYPVVTGIESNNLDDAYVMAQDTRVIFDSATHSAAVAVFTDGSHRPKRIEKSNATAVSAAGGAEAFTKGRINPNPQTGKKPASGAKPVGQPINNKIDCKAVNQKPHIPQVSGSAGSRTVALSWHYPTITVQDCVPSTYQVSVKLLDNGAPPAPASVIVESQTGTNLTGLFPNTSYEIVVTAYINKNGTASTPLRITTGPEGPKAPTNLRVSADSAGNWVVNWDSCGTVTTGCVEATSWRVIPSICDGRGLASPPAPLDADADPTTSHQPAATYKGGDALLGRGLQFQVEGLGELGTLGDASAKSACVTSWSPPDPAAMRLSASQPGKVALGASTTTDVTLDLGNDPVRAVGGVGARVTFTLSGPNGSKTTAPITYTGSGSTLSAKFAGVRAGAVYTATASVSPPGHPNRSVTVGPQSVVTSAEWPDLNVTASCDSGGGVVQLTCDLTVDIHGLTSAGAQNERFDTIDTDNANSQMRCGGGPAADLRRSGIDPAQPITASNLSLLLFNGTCTVTLVLHEASDTAQPELFGGVPSPVLQTTFTVSQPSTYNADHNDFTAQWDKNAGGSQVLVTYVGSRYTDGQIAALTQNWRETIMAPDGTNCGSGPSQPTSGGIDVVADPACVRQFGSQSGWSILLSYDDQGTNNTHTLSPYGVAGTPPGFQPCAPDGFAAAWDDTAQGTPASITVSFGGDASLLKGCSNFSYRLQDADGNACGADPNAAPPSADVIEVSTSGGGCDPSDGWTVAISWRNDNTGDTDRVNPDVAVTGTPPTS